MTVDELMQLLAGFAPDFRVVVNGYEDGYGYLGSAQLSVVRIVLNTGKHSWEGAHGDVDDLTESEGDDAETAEALARSTPFVHILVDHAPDQEVIS